MFQAILRSLRLAARPMPDGGQVRPFAIPLYLLLAAGLAACSWKRPDLPSRFPIDELESSPLNGWQNLSILRNTDAPWLSERISVQFRDLSAPKALNLVVPNGIISILFDAPDIPVTAMPGDITRKAHLNAICAAADWHWTVKDGVVIVSDVETRVWDLVSLPGALEGSVNTDQLYEGSGETTVNQTVDSNAHEELLETLKSMIDQTAESSTITSVNNLAQSYDGTSGYTRSHERQATVSSVALLPNTGQIIAIAPPSVLDRMEKVIKAHNEAAVRRVELEFVLFEVDVTDTESRRLDLKGLIKKSTDWSINIQAPAVSITDTASAITIKPRSATSDLSGSEVVFEWLQTQGDTSVQLSKNVVAMHNQVTVLSDLDSLRYIEEVTIQQQVSGPTGTISPSVTTARLDTGETWSVVASITGSQVVVRLASSRASLVDLASFRFTDAIQGSLPQTSSSSVSTSIFLRDGETRIISDLNSQETTQKRSRSPLFDWLLPITRGANNSDRRIETVIAMTARVL